MIKKAFIVLLVSLFFLFSPGTIKAQLFLPNTFDCAINFGACDLGADRCDYGSGCAPDASQCWSIPIANCTVFGFDIPCDCPTVERINFSPSLATCSNSITFLAEDLDTTSSYSIRLYRDTATGPEEYTIDSFSPSIGSYTNTISFNIVDDWSGTSCGTSPPNIPTGSWMVRLHRTATNFVEATNFLTLAPPFYSTPPPSGGGSSSVDWKALYGHLPQTLRPYSIYQTEGLTIGSIIGVLLLYLFPIAGLLLLLYLLYGGFMFLTSAGNPNKAQVAQGILTTALAGFAIIFTSYWLVQIVARVLGLPDIEGIFK